KLDVILEQLLYLAIDHLRRQRPDPDMVRVQHARQNADSERLPKRPDILSLVRTDVLSDRVEEQDRRTEEEPLVEIAPETEQNRDQNGELPRPGRPGHADQ